MAGHPEMSGGGSLADLLRGALGVRREEARRGLVQVFATHPATVARVSPLDDLGKIAAGLNRLEREADASDVVYVDRWAAAVLTGRAEVI